MEETVKKVPPSSKKRFPLYLRALQQLKQRGVLRVMSYQIGNMCNVSADTVRRDLMYVEHKGKTAAGYDIESLIDAFNDELGTNSSDTKMVLLGVGNIGQGLLKYNYIPSHIGHIVCAYDIDSVVGKLVSLKVKAIINFSDGVPRKRSQITVYQVDLAKIVSEIIYDLKTNEIK